MKLFLIFALLMPAMFAFSQNTTVVVSAQKQSVSVSLNDDNSDKVIKLSKQNTTGNFTAVVTNDEIEKDWKRNVIIYDADDNSIADFTITKAGTFCIELKKLLPKLTAGKTYFLYTTALPKDPQKAMMMKVARQLICKIEIN